MSPENRQEKLSRVTLIINSFVFIVGAYVFLTDGNFLYAGIIFFTGLFYLIAHRLMSVSRTVTELSLYILNMIVALITALDFFRRGAHYIQYVWLGISIVYLVFSFRQYFIWRKSPHPATPEAEGIKDIH